MEYVAGATIIRTIGLDLTIKCITGLTASAQGIYGLVSNISNNSHTPDIGNVVRELDLATDVSILESLLKEINIERHHTQTLAICLEKLRECVREIENQLIEMNTRLMYNKSLWIAVSMRSYGFTDIIDKLRILKKNMDSRRQMLFEVLKINGYLNCKENLDDDGISIISSKV